MSHPRSTPLLPILALVIVAACGRDAGATPSGAERPVSSVGPIATVPESPDPVTGEVPADILDRLLADAAVRSDSDEAAIEVVRAESVTWSDGSLGCPEPGMAYTQALVDGYHVVVEAAGDELDYRVTSDGSFALCEGRDRPGG